MKIKTIRNFTIAASAFTATLNPAGAQTAPLSRPIVITFSGVVANDPAGSIMIRQPDGTSIPYAGAAPTDFPYKAGDPVTVELTGRVPTQAYFDSRIAAGQLPPADGIYHIQLATVSSGTSIPQSVASIGPAKISGGLSSTGESFESNFTRLTVAYDSATGAYALDKGGTFTDAVVAGAGFAYDPSTGVATTCLGADCDRPPNIKGAFSLVGDASGTTISSFGSRIIDAVGNIVGSFSLVFKGSWNLPAGGDPVEVPEPGTMTLFGLGAMVPLWRRRALRKAAAA